MIRLFYIILILISPTWLVYGQNTELFPEKLTGNNFFIENKGQWENNILFFTYSNGMYVWVTTDAIVFDFYTIQRLPRSVDYKPVSPKDPVDSPVINGHIVKMKITGTDLKGFANQEIITGAASEQYNNYFKGNNPEHWASYVKLFPSVLIKNYIPGVDLKLYYDDGKFRYDMIVQPGINPNEIFLKFEGQDSLLVKNLHALLLNTSIGEVIHSDLITYQEINGQKKTVSSEFKQLSENDVGFHIKNYNPTYPVIIDPIIFSTLLGSSSNEYGMDLELDVSGNTILGGIVYSPNFPTTIGAYRRYMYSNYDVFISKFNSTGTSLIYSTYIGGNNVDYFYSLDIDSNGNCYYTGYTQSTDYPTTAGCYQPNLAGYYYDVMVTKLDSTGSALAYSTYLGGWYGNVGLDIAVDSSNNAYVCGYAYLGFPITSAAFQQSIGGSWDGFITKFNSSGTGLIYSSYLGGNSTDYCIGIAVDGSNNAYLTGYTASTNYPITSGCFQSVLNTGQDAFISKINSSGSALVYSTYIGGNSSVEQATDIAVNSTGNAYITGNTDATNFPLSSTISTYQLSSSGLGDGFITVMNTSGTAILYSTYIGGNNPDNPTQIAIDRSDNIVITGHTSSTNFPTTFCAVQSTSNYTDIFLCVLNPNLTKLIYSTYLGGSGGDYATGLTITSKGDAFITGYTYSSDYPVTYGSYQGVYYGGYDAVLTKLPFLTLGLTGNIDHTYCAGINFTMPYMAGCSFGSTNRFSVQLSNSSGSFNSPVILGSINSQTSGIINCNIPKSTTLGSSYRIRIVSSNPFIVSSDNGFNININPLPTTQFSVNNALQCQGNNLFQFSNSSVITSGNLTYKWDFGDSVYSTLTNPSHHYLNDTGYNVTLTSISDSGCQNSESMGVRVIASPESNISVNDSFQCLRGNSFSFNSSTIFKNGTYNILWDFGDGDTSSVTNPVHSYTLEGSYLAKLISSVSNGCKDSITKIITIHPDPVSSFRINNSTQCLSSNNIILTNTSAITAGSLNYLWKFGDGYTSTQTNPIHIYTTADHYAVQLIATSSSGCSDTASKAVLIATLPVAGFKVNNSTQCLDGNIFSFTNQSTNPKGNISYLWYYGDGKVDTIKNPYHSYLNDGTYTLKLIAFTATECADTFETLVVVNPSPVISFSVNDSNQCFNQNNFEFTNHSSIKSGTQTFFWTFGDGTNSSDSHNVHSYSTSGNFKVQLKATSNLNCKDSVTHEMLVMAHPVVNLGNDTTIKANQILVLNTGSSIDSARWSNGATTTYLIVDSAHFGGLGTKTISVVAYKSGCLSYDTIMVTIKSSVGIDLKNDQFTLSIFPNPVDESLQILITGYTTKADVTLSDMLGNRLFTESYPPQGRQITGLLDMTKYPKGAYLLKVICNGEINVVKVLKR